MCKFTDFLIPGEGQQQAICLLETSRMRPGSGAETEWQVGTRGANP